MTQKQSWRKPKTKISFADIALFSVIGFALAIAIIKLQFILETPGYFQ